MPHKLNAAQRLGQQVFGECRIDAQLVRGVIPMIRVLGEMKRGRGCLGVEWFALGINGSSKDESPWGKQGSEVWRVTDVHEEGDEGRHAMPLKLARCGE